MIKSEQFFRKNPASPSQLASPQHSVGKCFRLAPSPKCASHFVSGLSFARFTPAFENICTVERPFGNAPSLPLKDPSSDRLPIHRALISPTSTETPRTAERAPTPSAVSKTAQTPPPVFPDYAAFLPQMQICPTFAMAIQPRPFDRKTAVCRLRNPRESVRANS